MIVGLSIVIFVVTVSLAAGFLFATRVDTTTTAKILLGLLFGVTFLIALTGLTVAGCVVLITTGN